MLRAHRNHRLWYAFALHRLSGLLLALFLPFHFYVLGLALEDADAMDGLLTTSHPAVSVAEFILVFLIGIHLLGGLRILMLEFLPWRDWQKSLAAAAVSISLVIACLFLLKAA